MSNDILRVLVADDSAVARNLLKGIFAADPELQVIGEAKDGVEAVEMVGRLNPDVITMDVQMPRMDGLQATTEIMVAHPTPIVIVSSTITTDDVEKSMDAIRAGALAAMCKPASPHSPDFFVSAKQLVETVKSMATVKVIRRVRRDRPVRVEPKVVKSTTRERIVAIAASTGGPKALHDLLSALPGDFPLPILVVQHISAGFIEGFVSWLQHAVTLQTRVAQNRDKLHPGTVYVGAESHHLGVGKSRIEMTDDPPIGGFRPSATALYDSVAKSFGDAAIAVILTGMGDDGLDGLRSVRKAGGHIIAQDEESSVVFGMPRAAIEADLVDVVLPIDAIAAYLVQRVSQQA